MFLGGGKFLMSEVPLYLAHGAGSEAQREQGAGVPRSYDPPPPKDHTVARYLGTYGAPRRGRVLMGEVPLYLAHGSSRLEDKGISE